MPIRVELTADALDDLARYATSGNLPLFLKKLLRLEEIGKDAGLPLGRGRVGFRKIVVGDRDWRIVFAVNADETVATVWVIGDRNDSECYDEAQRRTRALTNARPEAVSLAAAMFRLGEMRRQDREKSRRRGPE